jgi:hypothetical protein
VGSAPMSGERDSDCHYPAPLPRHAEPRTAEINLAGPRQAALGRTQPNRTIECHDLA